ncbi:MAG: cell wall-binding repeat-containing protein [Anaerosomatales bacterium]|nr:cell wall-binding repeat-containing protein [Anaerosomatales bacterium]
MGIDSLTAAADSVVAGRVVGAAARAVYGANGGLSIVTDYRVEPTRVLKGKRFGAFTVTQPGGAIGDLALVVTDLPSFSLGEQCVLFLDRANRVVGGYQGKMSMVGDTVVPFGLTLDDLSRRISSGAEPPSVVRLDWLTSLARTARGTHDLVPLAAPTIASVTPRNANAGIGEQVTITGSGFGATQGAGGVEFNRGNSLTAGDVVTASVVSWSDTTITAVVPRWAEKWVRVVDGYGQTSATFAYDCGFSTDGRRWRSLPVVYRINENTEDMMGESAEIQAAFATWNASGSLFRLQYGGTTSASAPLKDGVNTVFFSTDCASGVLGYNTIWMWLADPPEMFESDILLNDNYSWGSTATSTQWDVQTVALHELGHTVGLDDQYEEHGDVMAAGSWGENVRSLSYDEIAGAIYLYGLAGAPIAPEIVSPTHPVDAAWSNRTEASFLFSAPGADAYSYCLDRTSGTVPDESCEVQAAAAEASFGPLDEGDWWFHVRARDRTGVWGPSSQYRLRIDRTPPVTSCDVGEVCLEGDRLTLSAFDGLSGVRRVYYGLDASPTVQYRSPILSGGAGFHTLRWYAVDGAGNVEQVRSASFRVLGSASVAGATRIATAIEASKLAFPQGAPAVVIATARNWPDALGGSALAGAAGGPVLLTEPSALPAEVAAEVARLGAAKAYIVGGTGAVSSAVETDLAGLGVSVERVAGKDRYATARAIAAEVVALQGPAYDGRAFLATGANFPDALGAGPLAAAKGRPIYLVNPTVGADAALITAMKAAGVTDVVVLGGTGAVPDPVKAAIASGVPCSTDRWWGQDRYATAAEVAKKSAEAGLSWNGAGIATGENFPDALSAGASLGRLGSVLLLTKTASLPDPTRAALAANKAAIARIRFFGGTGAVSQSVRDAAIQATY